MARERRADWKSAETAAREIRVYDARLAEWREAGPEDAATLARYGLGRLAADERPREPDGAEPGGDG